MSKLIRMRVLLIVGLLCGGMQLQASEKAKTRRYEINIIEERPAELCGGVKFLVGAACVAVGWVAAAVTLKSETANNASALVQPTQVSLPCQNIDVRLQALEQAHDVNMLKDGATSLTTNCTNYKLAKELEKCANDADTYGCFLEDEVLEPRMKKLARLWGLSAWFTQENYNWKDKLFWALGGFKRLGERCEN